MKVTKAQSLANRAHIVDTASVLFRERGYDGIGVADLMAAAGFTQGGFYKHFGSKADLMAEAAACGLELSRASSKALDFAGFIELYLSRQHRDSPGSGCTMSALCTDAARQPAEIKGTFAEGIERAIRGLQNKHLAEGNAADDQARDKMISLFAQMVGAVVLSRACPDDSPLADEILQACHRQISASVAPSASDE